MARTSNIRVLLVNPPFFRFRGLPINKFPIGLGYLKAVVRGEPSVTVDVYDADYSPSYKRHARMVWSSANVEKFVSRVLDPEYWIYKEILGRIAAFSPDIIGLTVLTPAFEIVQIMTRKIKEEISADVLIVVGGSHAAADPEELAKIKSIDLVVRGEGEVTFKEIVQKYRENSDVRQVRGISYYDENQKSVVHNPVMPLIQDLDKLPFPDRTSSFLEKPRPEYYGRMITSRGCPYSCYFCSTQSIWGRKVRFRSPENVVAEMKELKNIYKVPNIHFSDDNFTLSKERTHNICELIRHQVPGIEWLVLERADLADKSVFNDMKEAGCVQVLFGIESGSQKVLDRMRKGITIEQARQAVKTCKDVGLKQTAFFMIGHPGETRSDIQDTINLAMELDPSDILINIVTPYPGTELYEIAKRDNLLDFRYWFELQIEAKVVMKTGELTVDEVSREVRRARAIFERRYLRKLWKQALKRLLTGEIRPASWQDLKQKTVQLVDLLKRSFGKG